MTASPVLEVVGATSSAPNGTPLLDGVSFSVDKGWLVAVVGPTGAGKTSLAKALLGQLPLSAGTVRVTGRGDRSGRVAGVPQEDATHPQLSLRRTLDHAVALRGDVGAAKRRGRVDAVLSELGLTSRAGTRLSELSGGERKRANVAVELVGQPDLLVLDEPTAGLDPGFEKSVFSSLRELADTGRTIVAITHSVRALDVCDRVLFLARGGTVAFFGTPAEAAAYFDWDDPADAYAALSTEPAAVWKSRFATHQARSAAAPTSRPRRASASRSAGPLGPSASRSARPLEPATPSTITAAPTGRAWAPQGQLTRAGASGEAATAPASDRQVRSGHLRTLLHRAVQVATSDRRTLALALAAGPALGLLLWAVLPGSTLRPPGGEEGAADAAETKAAVFSFFLAMTITWLGAASAAREVVKERHILRRELSAGMSLGTYVTGKVLFLSGLTALQVVPLAAIAVLKQAPGPGPALGLGILEVLVVSLLVGVAGVATGLLVSTWASSSEKAMTALPVVLIVQLALAGPWAENRGMVTDVVRHAVPAKWAGSALAATVLGDASAWWLALAGLTGIIVVQLGGAFFLLRQATTSHTAERAEPVGPRLAAAQPAGIRFVPAALALVLALAGGIGALSRTDGSAANAAALASAATAAPVQTTVPPPVAPQTPPPAPVPTPPPPAAASSAPGPAPVPVPAPAPVPEPVPAASPPSPAANSAPRSAPAPTPAPTTAAPTPPPTTAPPAPIDWRSGGSPAATAPAGPLGLNNLLGEIFQPRR